MEKLSQREKVKVKNSIPQNAKNLFYLLEFAGLKDKLGRRIHFGDILTDEFNNLLTPVIEIEKGEHILFFKPLSHINSTLHIGCKSTYSKTLLIVDNIFDDFSFKDLQ